MSDVIKRARKHLSEICKDPSKFNMTIPVREDDSDMIFVAAFDAYDELKEKNEALNKAVSDWSHKAAEHRAEADALKWQCKAMAEAMRLANVQDTKIHEGGLMYHQQVIEQALKAYEKFKEGE